jgi:2-methylaconitate cis-trans-isomerase PrpF
MREDSTDVIVRSLSRMGFHHALQITASQATAAAAKIDKTVLATNLGKKPIDADSITRGHPSGTLLVTARFDAKGSISEAAVFMTARRIMKGQVFWKEV